MRLSEQKIKKMALDICKKGGIRSMSDIIAFLPFSRRTFYNYITPESEAYKEIQDALWYSKRKAVVSIRTKLFKSSSPTALITLYKMLCDEEERNEISMNKTDITTNGKELKTEPLIVQIIDKKEDVEEAEE